MKKEDNMLVYIYDLKIKGAKAYNCLKRNFYYSFNKLQGKFKRRTKSVIIVDEKYEKEMDKFFMKWAGNIELYKIKTDKLEQILSID